MSAACPAHYHCLRSPVAQTYLDVDARTRIQILDTIDELGTCEKGQGAAFIVRSLPLFRRCHRVLTLPFCSLSPYPIHSAALSRSRHIVCATLRNGRNPSSQSPNSMTHVSCTPSASRLDCDLCRVNAVSLACSPPCFMTLLHPVTLWAALDRVLVPPGPTIVRPCSILHLGFAPDFARRRRRSHVLRCFSKSRFFCGDAARRLPLSSCCRHLAPAIRYLLGR